MLTKDNGKTREPEHALHMAGHLAAQAAAATVAAAQGHPAPAVRLPHPPPHTEFRATLYRRSVPVALFVLGHWPAPGGEYYWTGEPLSGPAHMHYSLSLRATRDAGVDPAGVLVGVSGMVLVNGMVLGYANGSGYQPVQPWVSEPTNWPTALVRLLATTGETGTAELWTLAIRRSK